MQTNEHNHHKTNTPTAQACAACKHRRRKCTPDCLLSPYFPHHRHPQFLNAHRLFGVSNIIKIVRHLTPPERDLAMQTIIFESDARAADPVGGCHHIIRKLELRISLANAELQVVLHHLAICRAQRQAVPENGDFSDERWRETVDDVDSWGCVNVNLHAHSESQDESAGDMLKPILDHLGCDEFKFDEDNNS